VREGTRSAGLPPARREVAEVCSKAEAWLELRTGVMRAARSAAGAGAGVGAGRGAVVPQPARG